MKYVQDPRYAFEDKLDGTRAVMEVKNGKNRLIGTGILKDGRQRNYTPRFPELDVKRVADFPDCTLDGEIVVLGPNGVEDFQTLMTRQRDNNVQQYAKDFPATFYAFDILKMEGEDLRSKSLKERREVMEDGRVPFMNRIKKLKQFKTEKAIRRLWERVKSNKKEGMMIKDLQASYEEKRGTNWLKYLRWIRSDVYCKGEYTEGTGRLKG